MAERTLELRDEGGALVAWLSLRTRPGSRGKLGEGGGLVTATEGRGYRYALDAPGPVRALEPSELFAPDDGSRLRGAFTPGLYVGEVRLECRLRDGRVGRADIRVLPVKLAAESEHAWMLRDIAEIASAAVLQGFAPSTVAMAPTGRAAVATEYQRVALLHARLTSTAVRRALAGVLANPHRGVETFDETVQLGRPARGGTTFARSLVGPGPRRAVGDLDLAIDSLPERFVQVRAGDTFDTVPNRFVRFALERWRRVALEMHDRLSAEGGSSGPVRRGLDLTAALSAQLDRALAHDLFRTVKPLAGPPPANEVLLRREGYRELFRAYVLAEAGLKLAPALEVDDVLNPGQRTVAELYELWAFLVLARAVGTACGEERTVDAFAPNPNGRSWMLVRGEASRLRWTPTVDGRRFAVALFHNRPFPAATGESWSSDMRPDCSLRIEPIDHVPEGVEPGDLATWVHFDAKYAVKRGKDALEAKAGDLLKMHAYRDAIRGTSGAYVVFPGTAGARQRRPFDELVPGVGAFPLRPGEFAPTGAAELRRFVEQLLIHAADRASDDERERYWRAVVRREARIEAPPDRELPPLDRPPADARVLCGYVRSERHETWIRERDLYNVRTVGRRAGGLELDAAALSAEWIVLYGSADAITPTLWRRTGPWISRTRDELLELDYPGPRGGSYLTASVARVPDAPHWIAIVDVGGEAERRGLRHGAPFAMSWLELRGLPAGRA